MGLIKIDRAQLPRWQAKLHALEQLARYPIGDDWFKIDHGPDYFRFFERLGSLRYFAVVEGDALVAAGATMLRRVPFKEGAAARKCWYGGDLKVHPDHRGQRHPLRMASRVFLPNLARCRRGYGISMNPGDGSENRVVRLLQRFRWLPVHNGGTLELYSLDHEQMRACEPLVVEHRGPVSYLSLRGIKDIVLESTGQPMPLLHVQFGPCAEPGHSAPEPGHTHMFCTPSSDALSQAMLERGYRPSATATIIHTAMGDSDWRFVLTSDI